MSNEGIPPTTSDLKKLIDQAAAGSTAAAKRLEELGSENAELRRRIEALEKSVEKKKEKEPAAPTPAPTAPLGDDPELDLLGGWLS